MSSKNWDPLRDVLNISDRMNRMFQQFGSENKSQWQPAVDIYESSDAIVILAELPGLSEDDIDVRIENGLLLLRGEKPAPAESDADSYYRLERPFGKFARSFTVPANVDPTSVTASLKSGVLTITVKKNTQSQSVNVKIIKED
ncbi:MAG: Hsp20/alpha crystallin family protein [Deferribacteraceae bacterium]|jgi:HSP20 family protein|nr:Hsp20/alpha crystallin family protein [Deferribacteraceae bacterium]